MEQTLNGVAVELLYCNHRKGEWFTEQVEAKERSDKYITLNLRYRDLFRSSCLFKVDPRKKFKFRKHCVEESFWAFRPQSEKATHQKNHADYYGGHNRQACQPPSYGNVPYLPGHCALSDEQWKLRCDRKGIDNRHTGTARCWMYRNLLH